MQPSAPITRLSGAAPSQFKADFVGALFGCNDLVIKDDLSGTTEDSGFASLNDAVERARLCHRCRALAYD
jgi:hypothetical protein